MVLQRPSLRTKLMAIAMIGATIMALLGAGLIFTARRAKAEVAASQKSYTLASTYGRLVYEAAALEEQSWDAIGKSSTPPLAAQTVVRESRRRFSALLDETTALAEGAGPDRAQANAEIRRRTATMLAMYDRFGEIGTEIERLASDEGIEAATRYASTAFQPFQEFQRTVRVEADALNAEIDRASDRAAQLTRIMVFAAITSFALGLLLMVAQSKLIFGRLSQGLDRLEEGARAFGAGDLDRRICLGGSDELKRLSDVFDSMAQQLADKQTALEAAKSGLETAVAERTRELETANVALAEEDERRRRFLADVGHELRTPLTIIRGEAQVALRAVERGCADAVGVFGRILEQTQGMGRLVDDLFLIARAEAGGLSLRLEPVDLVELVDRVAHDFDAIAAEQGAAVSARPGAPVWAEVDADRVRQAVAALLDNALRHTRPGVRVRLEARADADAATIAVLDDGPGVPVEDAGELFGRFRRGETRGDGSGLGLSVVRALAEAHGGSARIENRPEGGAVATLRFPLAAAVLAAAE